MFVMIVKPKRMTLHINVIWPGTSIRLSQVPSLVPSITEKGLETPIVVQSTDDMYVVIDGNRRLAACEQLGHITIECDVFPAGGSVVQY